MKHLVQAALESGLRQAHDLLRYVRGQLAPLMRRTDRAAVRRALRLAEHFLRRTIALLSLDFDDSLGPLRPAKRMDGESVPGSASPRPPLMKLTEPTLFISKQIIHPMPPGLFDHLDPDEILPAGRIMARFQRIQAALAALPAQARAWPCGVVGHADRDGKPSAHALSCHGRVRIRRASLPSGCAGLTK